MAGNTGLGAAKTAKKDEFYTQLSDIEKEMRHYRRHFKGKTVLCNCDDPFESNFFKFFVLNFQRLGLKKLIATCYAGSPITGSQLSLSDVLGGDESKTGKPYKAVVTTVYDATGDGGVDMLDVAELFKSGENELTELEGDGDFRSSECLDLLEEADIVVTNPPFSLFREYIATLMEYKKRFIVVGHQNAITYKEIFPLIKDGSLWLGAGFKANVGFFQSPYEDMAKATDRREGFIRVSGVMWFTNLDIKKRHEQLILVRRYAGYEDKYPRYDNYDAIEVSKVADIPSDYAGVMGVPITFLDKHSPEQFEIIGITKTWFGAASKTYGQQTQVDKKGKETIVSKLNDGPALRVDAPPTGKTYYVVDDHYFIQAYARVLIRNLHPELPEGALS